MKVTEGKKIYFASDNHLGIPNYRSSLLREKKFVKWLDTIKIDAHSIYLLGEAYKPGQYTVSGLSSVTNALFVSGGVNQFGSLRNIQIKRNNECRFCRQKCT